MRVAVLGNSGSGKSTIAHWLARRSGAALLELDTVAWEPGKIAVARPPEAAKSDVRAFCSGHDRWVLEGCYADLVRIALEFSPRLLFLNPGKEQCLANCRSRPWEGHKYGSKEEQDKRLSYLLAWVREYYTRDGEMSLSGHRACFDEYMGTKAELTTQPQLEPPSSEMLAWLA
jgi:adenylate kinase family enzyme